MTSSKPVASNTGLSISLHPLPILNISEHYMRNSLRRGGDKTFGALLGTQSGREVSVINTFELKSPDVNMDDGSAGSMGLDLEFLEKRRGQYKEVFPTLDILGWYSLGKTPTPQDFELHKQFLPILETPLFLLMTPPASNPTSSSSTNANANASSDLPLKIYESALDQDSNNFVELSYTIETGEAERIAVDGAAKAGGGDEEEGGGDEGLVAHLNTQRNAIKMLHDRILVLLEYIKAIQDPTMKQDHQVTREIMALVSCLPVMSEKEFKMELLTEYTDTQLMGYLASLTKQVAILNDLTDKFGIVHGHPDDKTSVPTGPKMGMMSGGGKGGMGKRRGKW